MVGFSKRLFSSFKRPVFTYLVTLSISLVFIFSFLFYLAEGSGINPNIHEFFDALYYCTSITTSVGLGDIYPVTRMGKILTILMMFVGTGIFVTFSGTLAASILEVELEHLKNTVK